MDISNEENQSRELRKEIQIIFNKEIDNLKRFDERKEIDRRITGIYDNSDYVPYNYKKRIEEEGNKLNNIPDELLSLVDNPKDYEFIYPQFDRLKKIYYSLNSQSLKNDFIECLKYEISDKDSIYSNSNIVHLPFVTLLKLGFIDDAFQSLKMRDRYKMQTKLCFRVLYYLLKYEHNLFDDSQLVEIDIIISNIKSMPTNDYPNFYKSIIYEIKSKIDNIRIDMLDKKYEGINYEINQDKEEILKRFDLLVHILLIFLPF